MRLELHKLVCQFLIVHWSPAQAATSPLGQLTAACNVGYVTPLYVRCVISTVPHQGAPFCSWQQSFAGGITAAVKLAAVIFALAKVAPPSCAHRKLTPPPPEGGVFIVALVKVAFSRTAALNCTFSRTAWSKLTWGMMEPLKIVPLSVVPLSNRASVRMTLSKVTEFR